MSNHISTQRYPTVQLFSLSFGLVYLAVAIVGWVITGPTGEATIVIFSVNPLHNLVHTLIGIGALIGARSPSWASGALVVLGAALGLVTLLGFLGLLPMLGMHHGIAEPDNFLHLVTGAAALIVGLLWSPDHPDEPVTPGL